MSRCSQPGGRLPDEREPWYEPSIVLGASGPQRVAREDDADPEYEPPPFLGFTHVVWSKRNTGEVVAVAQLGEVVEREPGFLAAAFRIGPPPLLWEGDQA